MRREFLRHCDFVCPNEQEAQTISGLSLSLDDLLPPDPNQTSGTDPIPIPGPESSATIANAWPSAGGFAAEVVRRTQPILDWFAHEARLLGNERIVRTFGVKFDLLNEQ